MKVAALMTGRSALLPDGKRTAIAKHPMLGPIRIGRLGLDGDVQVNRKYHGGPEMAVHLYPLAHHGWWRDRLGGHPLLDDPGAFGGNIAVEGMDETQLRIGEQFRLGEALLEVSQPRMPCATIERRFARKGMVAAILESGCCGWYFRVLEPGQAEAGDSLLRTVTGATPWSVEQVFTELANPKAITTADRLHAMADCALLSPVWRDGARKKAAAL